MTYEETLAAKGLKPLSELTEDEYWAEYHAAIKRCEEQDIRCGCCNVFLMQCAHWQNLRLIINPSPAERRLLDSR